MFRRLGAFCAMASPQLHTSAQLASWHSPILLFSLISCVYVLDSVIVLVFLLYIYLLSANPLSRVGLCGSLALTFLKLLSSHPVTSIKRTTFVSLPVFHTLLSHMA